MALADVMNGLGAALEAIPGLRVVSMPSDSVNPPEAVVDFPTTVTFDSTFARGVDTHIVKIRVYVGRSDDRSARLALAEYFDGTRSIKAAVEQDPTLSGAAKSVRVIRAENVGFFDVSGISFLGCDFITEVLA
jgi:hypothetical protein